MADIVRDMRLLRCTGVVSFEHRSISRLFPAWRNYEAAREVGSLCVGDLAIKAAGERYMLELEAAPRGHLFLTFERLHVARRSIRSPGQRPDGEWEYVDAQTGAPVQFYDPFALGST